RGSELSMGSPTPQSVESLLKPLESGIRFSDEAVNEEDEWSDFTDEHRRHYTHLPRCIQMSLSSSVLNPFSGGGGNGEVSKIQDSEQRESGGDGIDVGTGQKDALALAACPWQKMGAQLKHAQMQLEGIEVKPEKPEKPEKQPKLLESKHKIYVPPALRHSQGDFHPRSPMESRQRKSGHPFAGKPQAPDLNSSEYFPSLGGSKAYKRTK
ncbi:hypothetical protein KR018_008852, partial [Drosophila ironensis]